MRMIEYRGVLIPAPPPMVQLSCEPGFTGQVVIELEDSEFVKQYPLRKEETFCSLEAFLELAQEAGYQVIAPAREVDRADSNTNS
ncbi:TPA: hypothetical protein ACXRXH_001495 [Klebsiella pneumoniae]|uniref:hypothetical protein n=1 Tax=Klebsiella pneumoniae TaxID=573 RepID=UPI0039741253|nr:hypothetical protein [Klebsiella pneumoniae]